MAQSVSRTQRRARAATSFGQISIDGVEGAVEVENWNGAVLCRA